MIRIKHVLYPTDFSSYSNTAYFHALALAENYGAALTVAYVFVPGSEGPDGAGGDRAYWLAQLESVRPSNPKIDVRHAFLEGDPATEIVRHAEAMRADVVVIGTHGRTGVERLIMGSVAERVVRDSPCSVVVVKLPRAN